MFNQQQYFEKNKLRLYNFIAEAFDSVPYYSNRAVYTLPPYDRFNEAEFKNIPILEKKDIVENIENLRSSTYSKSNLLIDSTSGTSGQAIICYKTLSERIRLGRELWNARRKYIPQLTKDNRLARFYAFRNGKNGMQTDSFQKGNELYLSLFDLSDEVLIKYLHEIVKFEPDWLMGPPTAIYFLALAQKKYNILPHKVPFIELAGEYASAEKVSEIQTYLGDHVANNYGSREFWGLAYSCRNNHLHINSNCYFETVYNDTTYANELIITTLVNKSWPLIRYKIGDAADIIYDTDCRYNTNPILNLHSGRIADYLMMPNGKVINGIFFSALARSINERQKTNIIIQYQVHVKASGDMRINILTDHSNFCNEIERFYCEKITAFCGEGTKVQITFNDAFLIEPSGKIKDIIIEKPYE